jgi:MFS family permease
MPEMTAGHAGEIRRPSYRTTALIIASALFMKQLDGTVLATALPTMARHFAVSPSHMSIALTSYLLSLAVLIPASGNLADRFGARTVFSSAIAIFTVGSILCAQAPNLAMSQRWRGQARRRRAPSLRQHHLSESRMLRAAPHRSLETITNARRPTVKCDSKWSAAILLCLLQQLVGVDANSARNRHAFGGF